MPVWSDPADAEITVNLASKARLRKLRVSHSQQEVDGEGPNGGVCRGGASTAGPGQVAHSA